MVLYHYLGYAERSQSVRAGHCFGGVRKIPNRDANPWKAVALVGMISADLAVSVLVGVWAGNWLDRKFGSAPLFLILGLFLGLGAGILLVLRAIKQFNGDDADG